MRIFYSNYLPVKGFRAINLFGIIVARKEYGALEERVMRHEAIHSRQIRELWGIGFYLWYTGEWLVNWIRYGSWFAAYRQISFEREAYANDRNELYLKERRRFAFLRFLRSGNR